MPKLYHSPNTRSSRVISQLMLMGKLDAVEVICVDIVKNDGTGRRDPMNAHPEGKVPVWVTDEDETIRESAAIMMYLDELYGQPLSPKIGAPGRGSYLSWMCYYGGVLEPALVAQGAEVNHPDSYDQRMFDIGDVSLSLSLKDKGALQKTVIYLLVE